jgi:pathogenesis-related protein 1
MRQFKYRRLSRTAGRHFLGLGVSLLLGIIPLIWPTLFHQNLAVAQDAIDPFENEGIVYVLKQDQWREALIRVRRPLLIDGQWVWYYIVEFMDGAKELNAHVTVDRIRTIQQAQDRGLTSNVYNLSSQTGIDEMLALHNDLRRQVGLSPLNWSEDLAESAQAWADNLLESNAFYHSPDRLRRRGRVGENLHHRRGNPGWSYATPSRATAGWIQEGNYYNYQTNTCAPGRMCGHYFQMVWADTREVGCGMARAADAHREVWACHYYPGGLIPNRRPY